MIEINEKDARKIMNSTERMSMIDTLLILEDGKYKFTNGAFVSNKLGEIINDLMYARHSIDVALEKEK